MSKKKKRPGISWLNASMIALIIGFGILLVLGYIERFGLEALTAGVALLLIIVLVDTVIEQ